MDGAGTSPLIVTAEMRASEAVYFDDLRAAHFPPERNYLRAHITMFHHLPGDEIAAVSRAVCAASDAPFIPVRVAALRFLGRGVAFALESTALQTLRSDLAAEFGGWLRPQDRQRWKPHITIQNKVEPAAAKALFAELDAKFRPFDVRIDGIGLWRYRGGPWEPVETFPLGQRGGVR